MDELELVRRGFDPGQVQTLVGSLASELKTMAADNDRLRARVAELEAAPRVSAPSDDVFAHWSAETNALLDAARASIASVTEKATSDAAAAVASGEMAGNAIRQRAQLDADQILTDARRQADEIALEAQRQAEATIAAANAEKAAREAEAQATVDAAQARVDDLAGKLDGLRAQRATMGEQLSVAKGHLVQLLALVEAADDEPQAAPVAPTAPVAAAAPAASTPMPLLPTLQPLPGGGVTEGADVDA